MTPEDELNQEAYVAAMRKHSVGSIVSEAVRAARLEALEEAAKIADTHMFDGPTDPTNIELAGRVIAAAIRERATQ